MIQIHVQGDQVRAEGDQRLAWQRIVGGQLPGAYAPRGQERAEFMAWTQFDCGEERFRVLRATYPVSTGMVEDSVPEPWRPANSDMRAAWVWVCSGERSTGPLLPGEDIPADAPLPARPPLDEAPDRWYRLTASDRAPTDYFVEKHPARGPGDEQTVWMKEFSPHQHHIRGRPWDTRYVRLTFACRARTVLVLGETYTYGGDIVDELPGADEAPRPLRRLPRGLQRDLYAEAAARVCRR